MRIQPGLFDSQPDARTENTGVATPQGRCAQCGNTRPAGAKPGRFCSAACRYAAWDAANPRLRTEHQKKVEGQKKAADAHAYELQVCRRVAFEIARASGTADIERVRERVEDMGLELRWGNWTWAVFRGEEWEPTGGFVEVRHRGGRRRGGGVRVWRIKA